MRQDGSAEFRPHFVYFHSWTILIIGIIGDEKLLRLVYGNFENCPCKDAKV